MSNRLETLEARRQHLLNRCEEQRLELAYRLHQLTPRTALAAWTQRRGGKGGGGFPVAWIAGLAGLVMMLRRRKRSSMAGGVGLATTLVALASRATTILRVLAQLRALYMTYKASHRTER